MYAIGLLVLRLVLGLTVAGHGAQKLFGWFGGPHMSGFTGMMEQMGLRPARLWAILAAVIELAGGLLVALGLLTPIAALLVASNMLVAIVLVHWAKGFWAQSGGFEYPLTLMAAMVAISLTGPGAIALDPVLGVSRLPEPVTWIVVAIVALLGAVAAILSPRFMPGRQPAASA